MILLTLLTTDPSKSGSRVVLTLGNLELWPLALALFHVNLFLVVFCCFYLVTISLEEERAVLSDGC